MGGKHTPGPWRTGADEGGFERCYSGPAIYSPQYMVAEVLAGPIDRGEANARLIAAAPDLLAALKNLTASARGFVAQAYIDDADAAITRAQEAASNDAEGL
jgi:hypothetical protein